MNKSPILLFCAAAAGWSGPAAAENQVTFSEGVDSVEVRVGGALFTRYHFAGHLSKPVLHPLLSSSGAVLTRDFPWEDVAGETKDHPHQLGVYFTYGAGGEVNGNSYWHNPHDEEPLNRREKLPSIRHIGFTEKKAAGETGTLAAINHWLDKDGRPLLEERRRMEFRADGNGEMRRIDFTLELKAVAKEPVTFGDTKEGMFAVRVGDWLAEASKGTLDTGTGSYLNAEGQIGEKAVWGQPSAWVRLEGKRGGRVTGVAILQHPESLHFPARWHARSYGCFSFNPLGRYDYEKGLGAANPQHSRLTLQPGESVLVRCRMVVYEGPRTQAEWQEEWAAYARKEKD